MNVKCPTCEKEMPWSNNNPWRPFCCERCKLIDLGAWASEEHRISSDSPKEFDETGPTDSNH